MLILFIHKKKAIIKKYIYMYKNNILKIYIISKTIL